MNRRKFVGGMAGAVSALAAARAFSAEPSPPILLGEDVVVGPPDPNAPSWVNSMPLNIWTAQGVNTFDDVRAPDVGQYGNSGVHAVLHAWNGGGYARTLGGKGSIIHCGAGHQDYHGNEVYAFDLEKRAWARLNDPSTANGGDWNNSFPQGKLNDGTPALPHSFYSMAVTADEMVWVEREVSNSPSKIARISRFNLHTLTWTLSDKSPGVDATNRGAFIWDESRRVFWLMAHDPLEWAKYDPEADSWQAYTEPSGSFGGAGGAVRVPTKDVILFFVADGVLALDPNRPTNDGVMISTTGSVPSFGPGDMMRWSANLNGVIFHPEMSGQLFKLTPPDGDWRSGTWRWSPIEVAGRPDFDSQDAGTYGKFNIVEWGDSTIATIASRDDGPYEVARLA